MTWSENWMAYGAVVLVFNTYQSTLNVLASRRSRNQSPTRGLLGLLPAASMWTLIPLYLYLRPHILHYHLLPFSLYVGLINAYSVGQIIVAHLTKSRFAYQNVLLLPLVFGVLDSAGPVLREQMGEKMGWPSVLGPGYQVPFVFCCLGLSVGVYGSFVVDVITGICDYLDIWCLTIKHPAMAEGGSEADRVHTEGVRAVDPNAGSNGGVGEDGKRSLRGKKGR